MRDFIFCDARKIKVFNVLIFGVLPKIKHRFWRLIEGEKVVIMRKKNYKGAKCTKRYIAKCEGVCKTYDPIQYAYADLLSESEDVKSFQVNVFLEGLADGEYTTDFVIEKTDGTLMVRECISRKHLTKPMTVFCE